VLRHLTSLRFLRCCPDIGEALTTHAAQKDHALLPAVGEEIGTLTVRDDSGVQRASKAVNELVSIPRRASMLARTLVPISGADLSPQVSPTRALSSRSPPARQKISGQLAWQAVAASRVSVPLLGR
jgi:hypothetical protein